MFSKDSPRVRAAKAINLREANADLENLEAEGYVVKQFTKWHWRVSKPDYRVEVDVWPSSKKMMDRETGNVFQYRDIMLSLKEIFDKYMP